MTKAKHPSADELLDQLLSRYQVGPPPPANILVGGMADCLRTLPGIAPIHVQGLHAEGTLSSPPPLPDAHRRDPGRWQQ